jgi:hypothetical protein
MTDNISGQPGWQIEPGQLQAFAQAVQQVRDDLAAVRGQVDQLSAPAYQPQLGTSPVGQALTAKFTDRVTGGQGILTQLTTAATNLEQFVATAERTLAGYIAADTSSAESLRTT